MSSPPSRLIWLLIDGLPAELAAAFAKRHPDTLIARCLVGESGLQACALTPLAPNCQTPPSLFTIWSGLSAAAHGITGYDVPAPTRDDPLRSIDGFSCWPREPWMAWDLLAHRGQRLRLSAMPFVQPDRLQGALQAHTAVYDKLLVPPAVLCPGQHWTVPELRIHYRIAAVGGGLQLHDATGQGNPVIALASSEVQCLQADTGAFAGIHHGLTITCIQVQSQPVLVVLGLRDSRDRSQAPCPHPAPMACNPGAFYQRGELGPRLGDGGQGEAERLLLDLMALVHASFCVDIAAHVQADDADAVFAYYPVIDLLCHQLLKHVHPHTSTPRERAVCVPLMDQALAWVDDLLALCTAGPRNVRVVAHSDHGMLPVIHDIHINVALERLGHLRFDQQGVIDLEATDVFAHPAGNGLLVQDDAALLLRGCSMPDVVNALRQALPATLREGWQLIEGTGVPMGKRWTARHYLQAPPSARWRTGRADAVITPSSKGGDHTVACPDPWLKGVLFDLGRAPPLPDGDLHLSQLLAHALAPAPPLAALEPA